MPKIPRSPARAGARLGALMGGLGIAASGHAAAPPTAPAPTVSELVIEGSRNQVGAVAGDVKPDLQISPEEIQSYGVSNMAELVAQLAPQTQSGRGRSRGAPLVLVNGARVSGFAELRDLPPEAILRVDILPEEAALKYGFPADQRVLNFVLRSKFQAQTLEGVVQAPTAGGRTLGRVDAGQFRIQDTGRFNVSLKYEGSTELLESDRGIHQASGGTYFDLMGNVVSAQAGAQIDPALSALAGKSVTYAGVPATAATSPPRLSSFVPTAQTLNTTDVSRYRTLLPDSRQATLNVVYAQSSLGGVAMTLNGALTSGQTDALRGLPGTMLVLPVGSVWSPFSKPAVLYRLTDVDGPLHQTGDNWTGHLGLTLNRSLADWRWSLTSAYDHVDNITHTDTGLSAAPAQALLNSGTQGFNPYGVLTPALFLSQPQDSSRTRTDNFDIQFLASGSPLRLPAGPVQVSVKLGEASSAIASRSLRRGLLQETSLGRNDLNGQVNLDAPVLRRSGEILTWLGDLTLNANGAVAATSDTGTLGTWGLGMNWTPVQAFNVILSTSHDQSPPTLTQLGGAVTTLSGVRTYDYVTGRTVDITQTSGGNPALLNDTRDVSRLGLTWKPISDKELSLTASYVTSRIQNTTSTLPAVTAEVEAAFPTRFVRDPTGTLIAIDNRPVNFELTRHDELRWGANFSLPISNAASPARGGQGMGGGRPSGQGGGGGGGGMMGGRGGGWQLAVYHTLVFKDEIEVARGVPVFDLLNGSAAGNNGGTSRDQVEVQGGYYNNGKGARLSANWKSGSRVKGGGTTGDLNFSDLATVNLRFFDGFTGHPALLKQWPVLKGARISLAIDNLFDTHRVVKDSTGAVPLSYQSGYMDPLGRTIEISFRKTLN